MADISSQHILKSIIIFKTTLLASIVNPVHRNSWSAAESKIFLL